MITATRNWLKRNRTTLAISAGVVGGVYYAGQWALGKFTEARQRMSDERIAKENLRRRFAQNQEDCTYTVLALLPTANDNINEALPVEDILGELQARKTEKIARSTQVSTAGSEIAPSEVGTEEGSQGTGSFVHASQSIGNSQDGGQIGRISSGKSKILLWDELKIASITRALTLLYVLPLLTLLTRVQLNLLGRRTYLSSVVSLASPTNTHPTSTDPGDTRAYDPQQPTSPISLENNDDDRSDYYGNDFATNRAYLTFSWWLLHRGWRSIQSTVEDAVREVFGPWNPRDNVSFERLAELILEVRKRVEGSTEEERSKREWLEYLLPPREQEEDVLRQSGMLAPAPGLPPSGSQTQSQTNATAITPSLRRLLDETSDLIDSPTFTHVLTLCLDSVFSLLVDGKVGPTAYKMGAQPRQDPRQNDISSAAFSGPDPRVVDVTDSPDATPTAKLATVLATFTKQASVMGRGGDEAVAALGAGTAGALSGLGGAGAGLGEANEYLAAVEDVRDLEAFAAVVYSSNFEFEGLNREEGDEKEMEKKVRGMPSSRDIEQSLVEVRNDVEGKLESAWDKAQAAASST